jgi:hypothetical protein
VCSAEVSTLTGRSESDGIELDSHRDWLRESSSGSEQVGGRSEGGEHAGGACSFGVGDED